MPVVTGSDSMLDLPVLTATFPCRRRRILVGKLIQGVRHRDDVGHDAGRGGQGGVGTEVQALAPEDRRRISRLLKRLSNDELERLWRSVGTDGAADATVGVRATDGLWGGRSGAAGNCVAVPPVIRAGSDRLDPVALTCRMYRWPGEDMERASLQRLPFCHLSVGCEVECCNPFHWSRIVDTKPPGKLRVASSKIIGDNKKNPAIASISH